MPYNSIIERTDAEALIPEEASRDIIANIANDSVVMRLGKRLPNMSRGQLRLPVLSALPLAYFVSEAPASAGADYKQTTKVEWENKFITAADIACIVPIPESVLDDADYDIWGEIRPYITEAIGLAFDAAVLYGTNAPSEWATIDDILTGATAARHVVPLAAGGGDLYDDILGESGVVSLVEEDGYLVTGHVGALSLRGQLRGLRSSATDLPIFLRSMQDRASYELDGVMIEFPLNGAVDESQSLLISGQWDKLVYSIRQDVSYKVLDQAVITDPTHSNAIIYNLAQQDMVALRVTMRIGWQLPNPVNRVSGTAGYPFAVLAPATSGS